MNPLVQWAWSTRRTSAPPIRKRNWRPKKARAADLVTKHIERWTTRIIVPPGATLVRRGPYRFLAHPNYLVVASEIAVLPLAFGLPWYALFFSLANATLLAIRIRAENAALRATPSAIS